MYYGAYERLRPDLERRVAGRPEFHPGGRRPARQALPRRRAAAPAVTPVIDALGTIHIFLWGTRCTGITSNSKAGLFDGTTADGLTLDNRRIRPSSRAIPRTGR
ncbi:MAG: hypothetical protein M0C28_04610 [Candidatus Moduliflexus flocculans]|nr:hypothetical protein [Candidatus Moduliflexus flocculans]